MLANGYIQSLAGLPIFKSRELYTDGSTSAWGCVFSAEAIGLAFVPNAGRDIWIDFQKEVLYQKVDYVVNAFFGIAELDDLWGAGVHTKVA